MPESDLSFDLTAALENQLRILLCAYFPNTRVKPKYCAILSGIIKPSFLKQSQPNLLLARIKSLMAAVEAGLTRASVSITSLGRAVSGTTFIKHKIKRLDRLVGNPHLKFDRLAL